MLYMCNRFYRRNELTVVLESVNRAAVKQSCLLSAELPPMSDESSMFVFISSSDNKHRYFIRHWWRISCISLPITSFVSVHEFLICLLFFYRMRKYALIRLSITIKSTEEYFRSKIWVSAWYREPWTNLGFRRWVVKPRQGVALTTWSHLL